MMYEVWLCVLLLYFSLQLKWCTLYCTVRFVYMLFTFVIYYERQISFPIEHFALIECLCQQRLNKQRYRGVAFCRISRICWAQITRRRNSSGFFGSIIEFIYFFASLFAHASLFFMNPIRFIEKTQLNRNSLYMANRQRQRRKKKKNKINIRFNEKKTSFFAIKNCCGVLCS